MSVRQHTRVASVELQIEGQAITLLVVRPNSNADLVS